MKRENKVTPGMTGDRASSNSGAQFARSALSSKTAPPSAVSGWPRMIRKGQRGVSLHVGGSSVRATGKSFGSHALANSHEPAAKSGARWSGMRADLFGAAPTLEAGNPSREATTVIVGVARTTSLRLCL